MSDCFDNVRTEDLDHCINEELVSGVSETQIHYALAAHIDSFPALPALGNSETALGDYATIATDITFPIGKGFNVLHIQSNTGEVKDELVGEKGNKKVKSMFSFFLPNNHARNLGAMRQLKNAGLVFIITEKSGRQRVLGSKLVPAYISEAAGTSGKADEDNVGFEITVDVVSSAPAPVYSGNITAVAA